MPIYLKNTHLLVGVLGFIVFVLTGQYMDRVHDHLVGMADGPRMLMRTAHLYIMLASLANLCLAAYAGKGGPSVMQWLISIALLLSPLCMTLEFFFGTRDVNTMRPYAYFSLLSLFGAGVILVLRETYLKLRGR